MLTFVLLLTTFSALKTTSAISGSGIRILILFVTSSIGSVSRTDPLKMNPDPHPFPRQPTTIEIKNSKILNNFYWEFETSLLSRNVSQFISCMEFFTNYKLTVCDFILHSLIAALNNRAPILLSNHMDFC